MEGRGGEHCTQKVGDGECDIHQTETITSHTTFMNSRTAYITYQNFQLILSATQSLYVGTELTVVRDDNDATMMPHLCTLLYNNPKFYHTSAL